MRIFVCLASPWSCVLILLLCAAWLHWLQCIWRVHCPPVTTRHPAGIIWCPDSDHWSSAPQDVLCWYFIPHFTSSDFTMHKQSEFMMRSLVMHCPLHQNQAGHSSGLQSWHSCGTLLDILCQWMSQNSWLTHLTEFSPTIWQIITDLWFMDLLHQPVSGHRTWY